VCVTQAVAALACSHVAEEGQIMIITGPVRDASLICGLTVGRAVNEKITGRK
jgi:hypothetical protein